MTHTLKFGKWMLAFVLVSTMLFPAGVFAANTDAVSLSFVNENEVSLTLDDDPEELTLYAVDGEGNSSDVTSEATWSSSLATVATVSDDGVVTPVAKGSATITAKYGDLAATKKVTVTSPYVSLTLSPDATANVAIGVPYPFRATATKQDGSTVDVTNTVTWSTYDTKVATVKDGVVTGLSQGSTSINAKYTGLTASATLYVRSSFQGLMLTPEEDQILFIGQTPLQIKAEVANAVDVKDVTADVTWTSSNPLNVTAENGVLKPWIEGTSTIKANYEDFTKSFKVTVYKTMKSLEPSVESIDLITGSSVTLPKVTGTAVDGTTVDLSKVINWTIDSSVATITNTKLTAEAEGDDVLVGTVGNMKVEIPVSVKTKVLTLTPSFSSASVVIGETTALPTVMAMTENGDSVDVTDDVEWTPSSTKALLQGNKVKGLVKGSVSIKGTYLNGKVSVSLKVEDKIKSITVTPTTMDLALKKSKSIRVVGTYVNGKNVTLSSKMNWVSSNPAVATVKGASVKAVGMGTTTLTGSYQGLNATVKVTVAAQLKSLTLSEKSIKLATGEGKVLTVTAQYDTGESVDVTKAATWTSTKTTVATVNQGAINTLSKGTASIKVEYGGKRTSTTVTVKDASTK